MHLRWLCATALVVLSVNGCGGSTEFGPDQSDQDASLDDSSSGGDSSNPGDDSTLGETGTPPDDGSTSDGVAPDSAMSDAPPGMDSTPVIEAGADGGCPGSLVNCGGVCVDVTSDTSHCGSCTTKCLTGQSCITAGGATACACPTGKKICGFGGGATCTDTSSDPNNCGMCGNRCASGETCDMGGCKCKAGASTCPGSTRCFDLTSDPLNCGTCGNRCAAGATCSGSKCTCPTGAETLCPSGFGGNACTDTSEDPNNCGMCGHRCADAEMCDGAGKCVCRTGLTSCTTAGGTFCVDTKTNARNCGGCGTVCPTGQVCDGGSCKTATDCSAGFTRCGGGGGAGGSCVNTKTDPLHCGDCGNVCNTNEVCVAGECRRYRVAIACTTCPCATGCTGGSACCPKLASADTFPICVEGGACP